MKILKSRFVAIAAACILIPMGSIFAQNMNHGAHESQLVKQLPASTGVFTLDLKRLTSETLSEVLVNKPEVLSSVGKGIASVREKTGIDLTKFNELVGGFSSVKQENGESLVEPVMLAQGTFKESDLRESIKIASKGTYKTIEYKGKTIYVFSPKALADDKIKQSGKADSIIVKYGKRWFATVYEELAITVLSSDVIAVGSLGRVKETIDGNSHISPEVLGLLDVRKDAILQFGANLPSGLSSVIDLGGDELGGALKSIRAIKGAATYESRAEGKDLLVEVVAVTDKESNAKELEATIKGLKGLAGFYLMTQKNKNSPVYRRMLDNAEVSRKTNAVSISLAIPQSDLDILLSSSN